MKKLFARYQGIDGIVNAAFDATILAMAISLIYISTAI